MPPRLGWPLWNICVTDDHGYVPLDINTSRTFPHSWLIGLMTRLTWRVSLVEQELLTLLEHLRSPPVFSWVRVTRSLVLYVCFVDRCLFLCTFSFVHCVVCSSIYGFWLHLWYLQTRLALVNRNCLPSGTSEFNRMVVGFTTPVRSVPITTNVVSSNLVYGEVYSIQHYVIKFVSDLRQVVESNWPPQ